jgi:hypothetical protein
MPVLRESIAWRLQCSCAVAKFLHSFHGLIINPKKKKKEGY